MSNSWVKFQANTKFLI